MGGETTRVKNRGETTRGETSSGRKVLLPRKPITITICNQMLLKLSVICENEIDDKAYCYTWAVLGLIGSNLLIQRD